MSLRTRLTLSYIGFFAIALIVLDVGLYLVVRQALIGGIDTELRGTAQVLQREFTQSNKTVRSYFDGDQLVMALNTPSVSGFEATSLFVQVYQPDGAVVAQSPNLRHALALNEDVFQRTLQNITSVQTMTMGNIHMRELLAPLVLYSPLDGGPRVVGIIQVARSLKETERALQLLAYVLISGGGAALLAAARGGAWLTRAAFRPIDEITQTAHSIVRAEDLSRRVPVPAAEDELQRLSVTINNMLSRMEELFEAQRRFVADVSHELRTPLAAMQGNLEVLERGAARDPALLDESLTDMRREVTRLIRMTNDLLLLAQSEAGIQLRHEPVELDTLLLEVHRELRPLARGVQLQIGHEDQVVVRGDRDRIKQALLNLGVNALQHTSDGGTVTLGLGRYLNYAALSVADTGTGISTEDLPHIFDRFYRADRARTHNRGGAGLGLAIVRWVAEAHGGYVSVNSTLGAGSTFTLLLPLIEPPGVPTLQFTHADALVH